MWELWYGAMPLLHMLRHGLNHPASPAGTLVKLLPQELLDSVPSIPPDADVVTLRMTADEIDKRFNAVLQNPAQRQPLLERCDIDTGNLTEQLCDRRLWDVRRRVMDRLRGPRGPFHVLNMSLNLVSGADLAWQQRKAESFTATSLHCGSLSFPVSTNAAQEAGRLGYRSSTRYGGAGRRRAGGRPISLGTAMAVSGASVNPNMGYHSSAPVAFLMTMFNVRLGVWLGNPGAAGNTTYDRTSPWPAFRPLVDEAFGQTDRDSQYVNLSDGGHFENLGLYEMVRRLCRLIFVSDAGQDPPFDFDDLGNVVRKTYIDMSVPIDFEGAFVLELRPRKPKGQATADDDKATKSIRCAMARVRYAALDVSPRLMDGCILYVKPTFYGTEPIDVYNYAQGVANFPHETTGDQFFSESQFESYRRLGEFTVDTLYPPNARASDPSGLLGMLDKTAIAGPRALWVEPSEGTAGTQLTVFGLEFDENTTVCLNGSQQVSVDELIGSTQLKITVPDYGQADRVFAIDLTVTDPSAPDPLTSTLNAAFYYQPNEN